MENWKPVLGYEDLYEVSSAGRVRSLDRVVRNGAGWARKKGRMLRGSITAYGYRSVALCDQETKMARFVHRILMAAFIGPSELSVDHVNGDKLDNRLENLRYCTLSENTKLQHAAGRTRFVRGEDNGLAKLTERDVREIRALLTSGRSHRFCGAAYGVTAGTIQAIKERRTWRHVS